MFANLHTRLKTTRKKYDKINTIKFEIRVTLTFHISILFVFFGVFKNTLYLMTVKCNIFLSQTHKNKQVYSKMVNFIKKVNV